MKDESMEIETTCCFTGHRPKAFPWGLDTDDPRYSVLIGRLAVAIKIAIREGATHFITGNAVGVDLWAGELVLLEKKLNPLLTLEIAVPFHGHNASIGGTDGKRIQAVHAGADIVHIVSSSRSRKLAFCERDRYMVDHSAMLIAVYDERSGRAGGTQRTLHYARERRLQIIQIPWMDI